MKHSYSSGGDLGVEVWGSLEGADSIRVFGLVVVIFIRDQCGLRLRPSRLKRMAVLTFRVSGNHRLVF